MKYRLLFISEDKPDTPEQIDGSMRMFAWALWQQFSKLEHIELTYHDAKNELPHGTWDFVLIHHSDIRTSLFRNLNAVNKLGARQVMWLMECPPHPAHQADYCFLWRPVPAGIEGEQIKLPYLRDLCEESLQNVTKVPGSVLLDHVYDITPRSAENRAWYSDLTSWLKPLHDDGVIRVGQLRRAQHENGWFELPDWIQSIPQSNFIEYMKLTAPFETFILTHPGSYEHSILDMVARGIRVLIPVQNGLVFAPQVEELKLQTFSTRDELYQLLSESLEADWRKSLCSDIKVVADRIDTHCRKLLSI
jgi:hypothetical protein